MMFNSKQTKQTNITLVGSGYVGMSLGIILSKKNNVTIFDIDKERVSLINNNKSPIKDPYIEDFYKKNINLIATDNKNTAYKNADIVIIAVPTDYNELTLNFDTSIIDNTIKDIIDINPNIFIVIKSTVPIGYTNSAQEIYKNKNIIFSPEFLREGNSVYDNLYPSRIVVGGFCSQSKFFANLLKDSSRIDNVNIIHTSSTEAEAIKLFSNTFLAMRVSFFNELDSFAMTHNLNTKQIIDGVSSDPRIGSGYNNPSFGYGGYCLPKDTKQLLSNYDQIPQTLIKATIISNELRKDFISDHIIKLGIKKIGIYKLAMKYSSDNSRSSSILNVIERLKSIKDIHILIYDTNFDENEYLGVKITHNINEFKKFSDLIVANRIDNNIMDVSKKVFSRDIFNEN